MAEQLPLPALLSQALVAFTIEFDNEFEHRMPHTTTDHGATGPLGSPWLVSMAMWFNCMQFIGEEPMPVAELLRRARTGTNLDGMRRWITRTGSPRSSRSRPSGSARMPSRGCGRPCKLSWATRTILRRHR